MVFSVFTCDVKNSDFLRHFNNVIKPGFPRAVLIYFYIYIYYSLLCVLSTEDVTKGVGLSTFNIYIWGLCALALSDEAVAWLINLYILWQNCRLSLALWLSVITLCLSVCSYSSGGEDGYVRVHYFDQEYFDFRFEF